MFLKNSFIVLMINFILTSICFGKIIEVNPGENLALNIKINTQLKSSTKNDIAITYTNQSDFSISTYNIPFNHVDTNRNLDSENSLALQIPENIKPGEYEIDIYLIENNQNNIKHYKVNSDTDRVIIRKSTSSKRPNLLKSDLDKSRVFLSEDALHITLDFLAPKSGFPQLLQVEADVKDRKGNTVLKNTSFIESSKKFGTMKVPIDFETLTNLKSESYKISVKLQSTKGLTGFLNKLTNSPVMPDYTYALGEVHILNENNMEDGKTFHISEFGAYPNDNVDDTKAIINAVATLKRSGGGTLIFEPGTYSHNDVIRIESITNFAIKGENTRLVATNSERSAVIFKECSNFSFSGFHLLSPKREGRLQEFESTGISVLTSENFSINNNLIFQSAAAGLMISRGSKYYQIHDNTILNTKADAIHSTGASAFGAIYNNITEGNGDDGIAVVSYINDKRDTHNIRIINNNVLGNYHGRGIAVVGGSNISIINNRIQETSVAGILIASEKFYNTYGTDEITISNNSILEPCQKKENTHPAILIYGRVFNTENEAGNKNRKSDGMNLQTKNILFTGNIIQSENCNGIFRLGPNVRNITIQENIIYLNADIRPIILNDTDYSTFTTIDNSFN